MTTVKTSLAVSSLEDESRLLKDKGLPQISCSEMPLAARCWCSTCWSLLPFSSIALFSLLLWQYLFSLMACAASFLPVLGLESQSRVDHCRVKSRTVASALDSHTKHTIVRHGDLEGPPGDLPNAILHAALSATRLLHPRMRAYRRRLSRSRQLPRQNELRCLHSMCHRRHSLTLE